MTEDGELTQAERGRLGGHRAALRMSPAQRQARSRKGGMTNIRERGKEYFVRMAMRRWGKDVAIPGELGKSPEGPSGPGQGG